MELKGAIALVTGGSGDTGAAIARALASEGVGIAATYTGNRELAEAVVADLAAAGQPAAAVPLDQTKLDSCEAAVAATLARFGRLDILVNNAAWNIGIPYPDLDALTVDLWDQIMDTNLRGPYLLARAAATPMRKQGSGRIINIASTGGLIAAGSSIAYSVSKAGLIHLTRCLAKALAPQVAVNCIAPGLIEGTRMAARVPADVVAFSRDQAVLGRVASIDDIAAQVVAFCRYDSVTGQTLVIDGGLHFH